MTWAVEVEAAINIALPGDSEPQSYGCWIPIGDITVPARTRRETVLDRAGEKFSLIPEVGSPAIPVRIVDPRYSAVGEVFSENVPQRGVRMRS